MSIMMDVCLLRNNLAGAHCTERSPTPPRDHSVITLRFLRTLSPFLLRSIFTCIDFEHCLQSPPFRFKVLLRQFFIFHVPDSRCNWTGCRLLCNPRGQSALKFNSGTPKNIFAQAIVGTRFLRITRRSQKYPLAK